MSDYVRGTTLPITLDFTGEDVDFTALHDILVTFEQGGTEVTVTPTVDDAVTLTCSLTQVQALKFKAPSVVYPLDIQVNALNASDERVASLVTSVTVERQLYDEVIS